MSCFLLTHGVDWLGALCSAWYHRGSTAIGDPQDGRWKITLMFDGRRFCIPKFRSSTLQQTTLVISDHVSDHVLLRRNQLQTTCFTVIG